MVIPAGNDRFPRQVALPWASVDPHEDERPTDGEPAPQAGWFLEPPPGRWEMDDLQTTDQDAADTAEIPLQEEEEELPPLSAPEKGGWTLAILCMGLGLIAACVIIPQADANRRLVYQREKLRLDLAQIQSQVAVNKEFLAKIENDPQLIERLAQREMRSVPRGETVLDLTPDAARPATDAAGASADAQRMSPFTMIDVPPPPPLPAYQPVGGTLAGLCRKPQSRLYVLGTGMFLAAAGLVLGDGQLSQKQT